MVINTIYIGEYGPTDPRERALLEVLVGEDIYTFSPREKAVCDRALLHGDGPGTMVSLSVPDYSDNKRMLDAAIQVLLRVDTE